MQDFAKKAPRKRRIRLIDVDSWIDSSLYGARSSFGNSYEGLVIFFRRFQLRGLTRWVNHLFSNMLTFGTIGAVLALFLALPAFDETRGNDWLTQQDYSVTFLDRFGTEIGERGIRHDDNFELNDLPPHLLQAVLATEDRRFYRHFGIDIVGTTRAMVENIRARTVVQGGSSITQQLAKNLFLTNERSLERKIKEAFLALWLEFNLTKPEILKLYLDRAYMGGGNFGVAAAADFYFGKSVNDITLAQSAMLAGLFKAPTKFAPHVNLPAARLRANEVLTNMVQAEFLTEGQVIAARRNPASPVVITADYTPDYFLDFAFEEVRRLAPSERVVTVRTTIDVNLQRQAEEAVEANLRQFGQDFNVRDAAVVLMESDGAVVAIVGGRDYGDSQFNRAVSAKRQPGSSFKPVVYATALKEGYTPKSVVKDAPIRIGDWSPQNYNRRFRGNVTLKTALTKSINTIPVRLAQSFGRDKIVETARDMGITSDLLITRSLPLGSSEITPLEMATAYSTFANGGYKPINYAVTQVIGSSGRRLYDHWSDQPPRPRVLPVETVRGMNDMLSNVVKNGTGRRSIIKNLNTAGKTGTTNSYRDAWFVGFSGNYVAAVWFGNDNYEPTRRLTGGNLPARTWRDVMLAAHQGVTAKGLPYIDENPESEATSSLQFVGVGQLQNKISARSGVLSEDAVAALASLQTAFSVSDEALDDAANSDLAAPVLIPVAIAPPVVREIPLAEAMDPTLTRNVPELTVSGSTLKTIGLNTDDDAAPDGYQAPVITLSNESSTLTAITTSDLPRLPDGSVTTFSNRGPIAAR